jgi:protein-tyrosine phosphatase
MTTSTAPLPPRSLPIEGGHNLRDLGGYPTEDGRQLKWHTLYRAGAIYGLPPESRTALRELGILAICDLRTPHERAHRPMDWHDGLDIHYYGGVKLESGASLEQMLTAGLTLQDHMRQRMLGIYRSLPFEQAPSYRHLFALLAAGRVPLLFNCSAGKDRTGVAAALLLTALGVPRETILEDYLLSNEWAAGLQVMMAERSPAYAALLAVNPDALAPVLTADADYLKLAFEEINRVCGSLDTYLARHLGIGPAELAQIRAHLLD